MLYSKMLYYVFCRRLAKSTLLLIPLFGVNYVVFVYMREESQNDIFKDYKIFFDLGLGSFQVHNMYDIIIIIQCPEILIFLYHDGLSTGTDCGHFILLS